MIKVNWNIDLEERQRILNLHENATKNQYLIKEQQSGQSTGVKSWTLCSHRVLQEEGRFYVITEKERIEIPKLSEVSGTINGRNLDLSLLTQNGLKVGGIMKESDSCLRAFPMTYTGNYKWFCYFDDVSKKLTGSRGQEKFINKNSPVYGVMSYDGSLQTGGGDFLDTEIKKDKNGTLIQYGVSRSKSFIIEVSPAMEGKPNIESTTTTTTTTTTIPQTTPIQLNIDSPFVFDKVELTPEATEQFNTFVQGIKRDYQGVTGNVDVITSASIDAEPKSKESYNMDLSTRRANAIIDKLKSMLGQTSLTFIPKPIGQTDQFAPGLKWPKVKDVSQTAPNRKLIITLPKITKQIK